MRYLSTNWLPLFVVGVGFVASICLAFAPIEFLLMNLVPDDSFYYFQIARNIVEGNGSTFDGMNPTNGYHPLWLLTLLPIFSGFSTGAVMDLAPIHVALVTSAVLSALTGIVLIAIARRYTRSMWVGAAAVALWTLNPFTLYEMLNGLETPLSVFLVALFILAVLRASEQMTWQRLVFAGVIGGFMMLARLDNVLYFVMFLFWLLYDRGVREGFLLSLRVGIPATIVVAPWLIWNYLTFGMLFTSASAATTLVNHALIVQDHGPSIFQKFKAVFFMTDYTLRQIAITLGAPSILFVLFGASLGWLAHSKDSMRAFLARIPVEWFLFGGFILIFIVNASVRWSPREWYFVPLGLFVSMWAAWFVEELRKDRKLPKNITILVSLLVVSLFYVNWSKNLTNPDDIPPDMLRTALWMNENLPQGTVVGAFNAGIMGYFSSLRVVNLDGLVNNRGYEALHDREVWRYMEEEGIMYLADQGKRIEYRFGSFLGIPDMFTQLEEVYVTESVPTVYKVRY